jgi:integrase
MVFKPKPFDIPGFTWHKRRGGWCRMHRGKTLWCGGAKATRQEVEETFHRKRGETDNEAQRTAPDAPRAYRVVLGEFLTYCQRRVETGKPRPMSRRTLHNYDVALNAFGTFVGGGTLFADTNDPRLFAEYAAKFGKWKASGYDSVVARISALYEWAAGMEHIDRFRPGPAFQRPAKSLKRDERIDLSLTFGPAEYAKLYAKANHVTRCWLGLGLFAAMNNSEVAWLDRRCVDLDAGVVDFRRRKIGKVRRVCPLPDFVVADLRSYRRPEPIAPDLAGLFFLTVSGRCYTEHEGRPSDSMSRMFREMEKDAVVAHQRGRNFKGLRTTFYNLAPRHGYDLERKIIMGRAHGTVDLDSYLEDVGLDRLRHVVAHVFDQFSTALTDSVDRSDVGVAFAASAETVGGSPAAQPSATPPA